jgi:serine/threonine-protein kinase
MGSSGVGRARVPMAASSHSGLPVSQSGIPAPPPSARSSLSSSAQHEQLPRQFGKYTLLRAIASGGMAKVYLAIQRAVAGFEKLVVIKRILPELSRDQAFVEMLLTEARTAATLNHPNVVQTFDVGEVEGTYYIAMEHINGEDIRSVVRAMKRVGATEFPLEHALSIVLGVCAGLAYAHEKRDLEGNPLNIVHRDISPQNVLITFTGDVKVVDFGIAKSTEAAVGESTQAGQLKGKVPYMSPEQASGKDIDHRSDIFAAGIMLFELTTGRRLFKAKSEYETLKLICERDYPRPSQIRAGYPAQLEQVVMRALAKDPAVRYQNARDMQADLEAFIREERIAASAVSLANWMKMLFEDKIAEQKEALQDVKQLADVIASQRTSLIETDLFVGTQTTTGAATISGTNASAFVAPAPKSRMWIAAVALLAVVGVGFLVLRMRQPEDKAAETHAATQPVVAIEPAAKKGKLSIKTDPPGAYVRIGGELQSGQTPLTIDKLPVGSDIDVKVSMEGFESVSEKVQISESALERDLSVKLVKGTVTIVFEVFPKGAALHLDDKPWNGKGNRIEELSTGDHKLVFTAQGYAPQIVRVSAQKGETKTISVTLKKGEATQAPTPTPTEKPQPPPPEDKGPPGSVAVNSRGGFCSNVVVAGRSAGPTPALVSGVGPGPVSITCKTSDGRVIGSGATVVSGQTARVTITIP